MFKLPIQTLRDKRAVVVEQLKKMQSETEPILAMFSNPEVTRQIQSSRDSRQLLDYLTKNHGLKPEMLDKLYLYAKFQYECGNYSGAADYLHFHRFLVTPSDKVSLKFKSYELHFLMLKIWFLNRITWMVCGVN